MLNVEFGHILVNNVPVTVIRTGLFHLAVNPFGTAVPYESYKIGECNFNHVERFSSLDKILDVIYDRLCRMNDSTFDLFVENIPDSMVVISKLAVHSSTESIIDFLKAIEQCDYFDYFKDSLLRIVFKRFGLPTCLLDRALKNPDTISILENILVLETQYQSDDYFCDVLRDLL